MGTGPRGSALINSNMGQIVRRITQMQEIRRIAAIMRASLITSRSTAAKKVTDISQPHPLSLAHYVACAIIIADNTG